MNVRREEEELRPFSFTHVLFLSGTGAAGSPACVGTSPWHLHWHRPESGAGRFGSPPPVAPEWPKCSQNVLANPSWPQVRPVGWLVLDGLRGAVAGRGAARCAGALTRSSVPKWMRASLL